MNDELLEVLQGEVNGRPLISLWRHFPEIDLNTDTLVEATVRDYRNFPSDLIKLSPQGRFPVVDFGCKIRPGTNDHGSDGSSKCTKCVVTGAEDWENIEEIDPNDGELGRQVEFVERVRKRLEDVPIMMTVFSPTMVARKLSANQLTDHLETEYREDVIGKVEMISRIMVEFSRSCIDAGADGIFAAIQEADRSAIPSDLIDLMLNQNKPFMNQVNKFSEFTVLHLHGDDLAFERALNLLKPTAVNWHDQTAGPSIQRAAQIFDGGLLGGLDPHVVLNGNIENSLQEAKNLRKEVPMILAPGCVLLQGTKDQTLSTIFEEYL